MGDRMGGREAKGSSLKLSKKNPGAPASRQRTVAQVRSLTYELDSLDDSSFAQVGPVLPIFSPPPPLPGPGKNFDCGAAMVSKPCLPCSETAEIFETYLDVSRILLLNLNLKLTPNPICSCRGSSTATATGSSSGRGVRAISAASRRGPPTSPNSRYAFSLLLISRFEAPHTSTLASDFTKKQVALFLFFLSVSCEPCEPPSPCSML